MVQIIPVAPNPAFEGLSRLAEAIGARLNPERRREEELKQKQREAFHQMISGDQTMVVGDGADDIGGSEVEAELSKLENLENFIIMNGMADTPEGKEQLKAIRSRRGVVSSTLGAGEQESSKLAAKRRSESIDTISGKGEAADSTLQATALLRSLKDNGETGPSLRNSLLNYTEGAEGVLGAVNDFLTTVESQGFKSAQLAYFPQLKKLFGSRVTDRDLKTFMESLARFGTDPAAQELALRTLEKSAEFDKRMGESVLALIDDDGRPVKSYEKKLVKLRNELNAEMQADFQTFLEESGFVSQEVIDFRSPTGEVFSIPKNNKEAIAEAKRQNFKAIK